ncbi:MAG: hypothetical protein R2752_18095 [Vicinamibacterales bacterium]
MLNLRFAPARAESGPPAGRLVNTWRDDAGRVLAQAFRGPDRDWIDWPQLGRFAFHASSRVIEVTPRPGVPRAIIEDTFHTSLQPIILQVMGRQAMHASAALGATGVLAFCGRAGTGKSTLAFAIARAGHRQVADDAIVLSHDPERVLVHPLPFAPQLRAESLAFFGEDAPLGEPARRAAVGTPNLGAVFALSPDASAGAHPRLRQLSAVEAFPVLLAHAHCFDVDDKAHTQAMVETYLEIAARVPVFDLAFAPRWDGLPALVATVLGAVPDRRAPLGRAARA